MGFNSTLIVMNDALEQIREDQNFGRKVAESINSLSASDRQVTINSGDHYNAATVVETHHADGLAVIVVGGNQAQILSQYVGNYRSSELEIVKSLAEQLGYRLVKA